MVNKKCAVTQNVELLIPVNTTRTIYDKSWYMLQQYLMMIYGPII